MHDFERGFRIDGVLIDWGTSLATAAEKAGVQPDRDDRTRYSTLRVPCARAYGFDTLAAEFSSHGLSRPVTSVSYELLPPGNGATEPDCWTRPMSDELGAPTKQAFEDLSGRSNPSDGVRYYARWDAADISVGLSVYGALREISEGRSAGMLWLSWSTERAAAPFLPGWRAACESLAVAARRAQDVRIFTVGFDQHAQYGYDSKPGEKRQRESYLALAAPEILLTPKPIADRLSARQFALWSNADMKLHCLSTRWDSVIWDEGAVLEADWWHILPAKGPGQSSLHVGPWSVVDYTDSTSVPAAVKALEAIPGVRVRHEEGHDC